MVGSIGCTDEASDDEMVIRISDIYCNATGNLTFSLNNSLNEDVSLRVKWALLDPKAGEPVHNGSAVILLKPRSDITLVVDVDNGSYDARFYIMRIRLIEMPSGDTIGRYEGQKSPYDWDYSTEPPR